MRKTKIICTIGPSSDKEETLIAMAEAGMNVARANFSHGTHEQHKARFDMIKKVREELNLPIAIMLDTKGPEYRIGLFKNDSVNLKSGDTFIFTTDEVMGDETKVSVSYKKLHEELNKNDVILVNNGLVKFIVKEIKDHDIITKVDIGGVISNRKSMSFPNKHLKQEFLSEADKSDLLFGIENDVDYVAASFVSCKQDMLDMRYFLDDHGGKDIEIIAKIENRSGVENIKEICEIADGVMVARGDLGVEVPFIEVPSIQKKLIKECRMMGKIVITATEMLESMIQNPRPTRAVLRVAYLDAVVENAQVVSAHGSDVHGLESAHAAVVLDLHAREIPNRVGHRLSGESLQPRAGEFLHGDDRFFAPLGGDGHFVQMELPGNRISKGLRGFGVPKVRCYIALLRP